MALYEYIKGKRRGERGWGRSILIRKEMGGASHTIAIDRIWARPRPLKLLDHPWTPNIMINIRIKKKKKRKAGKREET